MTVTVWLKGGFQIIESHGSAEWVEGELVGSISPTQASSLFLCLFVIKETKTEEVLNLFLYYILNIKENSAQHNSAHVDL